MAKLYFRYGTVGSAKTMNLLAVTHNYQQQSKQVLLLKPKLDVRFGLDEVRSRTGLSKKADMLLDDDTLFHPGLFEGVSCVLVDEAQFLSKSVIDQLRYLATVMDIPVICYGLRTDFRGELFPGSHRLFEVADTIEEVKTTCSYCNKKAIFNLKLVDGRATLTGPTIELGSEERYIPTCSVCYRGQLEGQYLEHTALSGSGDSNYAFTNALG
jgi:thymidine kinase